jgi:hypothetical protein
MPKRWRPLLFHQGISLGAGKISKYVIQITAKIADDIATALRPIKTPSSVDVNPCGS